MPNQSFPFREEAKKADIGGIPAKETDLTRFNPQRNDITVPTPSGLMKRLQGAVNGFVNGFWTPGTPLQTIPPEGTPPRQFDFQTTANIDIAPRSGQGPTGAPLLSFQQLRGMADNWDVLRSIIQRIREGIAKQEWSIMPEDEAAELDDEGKAIIAQLRYPDGEHDSGTFFSAMAEEALVTDALAVEPVLRPDKTVVAFYGIDGATIQVKIDERGRTPMPPNTAYQQVIKGVPWVNFTSDNLVYRPWNYRFNSMFGYSKVEQLNILVNIGLRRQMQQLYAFTDGTMPEALMTAPESWNAQQIAEFQDRWDSRFTNNLKKRAKTTWVPHGATVISYKADPLKDEFDEWCARLACFIFGISPQGLVKEMNRATAQTAKTKASQEGLEPVMAYLEGWWNYVLKVYYNRPDLRFKFSVSDENDPKVQNDIAMDQIKAGALSVDEFMVSQGRDPIGLGPYIMTGQGPILVSVFLSMGGVMPAMLPPPAAPEAPETDPEPAIGGKAAKSAKSLPKGHLARLPMPGGDTQKKTLKLRF